MKKSIAFTFILVLCQLANAQKGKDALYLKDGSIIKGTVIKEVADSSVSIRTDNGRVLDYTTEEIKKVVVAKDAEVKNNSASKIWFGLDVEPQMQDVIQSKKHRLAVSSYGAYPSKVTYPLQAGVTIGASLYYEASQTLGFETGLFYHLYQTHKITVFGADYDANSRFSALEIPMYLNLHTNIGKVRFYSSFGFAGGVILSAHFRDIYSNQPSGVFFDTTYRYHADSSTALYCTLNIKTGVEVEVSTKMLLRVGASFTVSGTGDPLGNSGLTFGYPYYYINVPYSLGLNVALLFRAPKKNKKSSS